MASVMQSFAHGAQKETTEWRNKQKRQLSTEVYSHRRDINDAKKKKLCTKRFPRMTFKRGNTNN